MVDSYLRYSQSSIGKKVCNLIGLPVPPHIERAGREPAKLVDNIFVGGANDSHSTNTFKRLLPDSNFVESTKDNTPVGGLIFDATSIETLERSEELYQFFNHHLRKVEASGKIVIVGINPKQCNTIEQASVQRGLVGFVKSIAKEVGRKGITANLIYSSGEISASITSALRFLLSHRSAYVNGQTVSVDNAEQVSGTLAHWDKPLSGKVALVTGASRGIGASIAQLLARDGAKVIGLDIPQAAAELNTAMAEIDGEAITVNITDDNAAQLIDEHIANISDTVDIVVHNAGITRDKMLVSMSKDKWQQVLDVNLTSVERINRYLLNNKRISPNGRVVCVSSISGIAGNLGQSNYAMSKAGVIGLIESSAEQFAEQNITINAVAPGFIETSMTASIPVLTRFFGRRMCAVSQGGLPVDVAETIAFLSAPQSQGITANLVRVCGLNIMGT